MKRVCEYALCAHIMLSTSSSLINLIASYHTFFSFSRVLQRNIHENFCRRLCSYAQRRTCSSTCSNTCREDVPVHADIAHKNMQLKSRWKIRTLLLL